MRSGAVEHEFTIKHKHFIFGGRMLLANRKGILKNGFFRTLARLRLQPRSIHFFTFAMDLGEKIFVSRWSDRTNNAMQRSQLFAEK